MSARAADAGPRGARAGRAGEEGRSSAGCGGSMRAGFCAAQLTLASPAPPLLRAACAPRCSNGIFCDGAERFVGGKCVPAHPDSLPCVYGEGECYVHACLEDTSSCALEPIAVQRGEPCATCSAPSALRSSAAGVSAAALPSDGTCESPKPLFAAYNAEAGEESYVLKFAADGASTSVKTTAANAPSSPVQVPVEGIRLRVVQKSTDGYQDAVRPTCSGQPPAEPARLLQSSLRLHLCAPRALAAAAAAHNTSTCAPLCVLARRRRRLARRHLLVRGHGPVRPGL